MSETVVQMIPMLVLGGLIAGWSAEAGLRAGGYGFIPDSVLGLLGSLLAGAISWLLVAPDVVGMMTILLIGCAGAALTIVAQRSLWRSGRLAT